MGWLAVIFVALATMAAILALAPRCGPQDSGLRVGSALFQGCPGMKR